VLPRDPRGRLTATPADSAAARERLGIPAGRRVVLYMPTHREWLPDGRRVLDTERFAEELGPDSTLLVREHYFTTPAEPASGAAVVDVSDHPVVEDLYLAADVLLTDYSSAMFDFAVLDRPIVIFAPDWPVYRDVRGVYFDLLAEPPGAVATEYAALVGLFQNGSYADESAAATRGSFRTRFCSLDDGHAAERVVRRVFFDTNQ